MLLVGSLTYRWVENRRPSIETVGFQQSYDSSRDVVDLKVESSISTPPEPPTSNPRGMERLADEPGTTVAVSAEPESYTMPTQNTGGSRPGAKVPHQERGYRKLATFMVEVDDVVIFRKFQMLNMLNLFRWQAELAALQLSYDAACDKDDNSSNPEEKGFTQSFYELREYGNISPGSQLDLLDRINDTLQKYSMPEFTLSELDLL
jgi:hypothetical protein